MAADTIIQIKRTTGTGVPAGGAERGELVYVYDTSDTTTTGSQGGNTKRLFIGDGSGQSLIRIGGEYYTNLLEAPQGTLTANKAIVTDNNKGIDDLYVGNNSTTGGSIKLNEGTNNGSHYVALKASDSLAANITFRLPVALPGSAGQSLVSDTSGNLSFQTLSGTLDIAADSGTDNGVVLGTDTLTITGGTGISTSVSGDTITVNGDDATTTTKGIASFATADFGVTSGAVSLSDTVVKTLSTDSGAMTISNHEFSVLGGEGIDVTHTGTSISVVGEDATDTNKGIATFNNADFLVTSGDVTIKSGGVSNTQLANNSITFGATAVALGSTVSSFSDVTTITTTNGADLTLSPAGDLVLNSTGDIDANNNNIINVATPVNANDAANKEYVDAVAEGLHIHASVEVATTAALTGTYSNGTGGIGATFTLTSPIAVSTGIDGFTDAAHLVTGARILIKNQSNDFENGIYTMNVSGSAGSEQIDSFTRADDFNTPTEVAGGDFVFVIHGTNYANTGWVQTEHVNTIGSDTVSFSQFSGAGTFLAGNGLTLTGNTFDVVGTTNRITVNANDIDIASTYAGQTSITTLGTIATGTWNADVIGPVYGGTGLSSYTAGDLLYASGTNTLSALAAGTNGYILYSNNGTPAWLSAIDLTTQVTGTLPVASGGTGATTFTSNGILYGNGTNALQVTAAGTDGFILYSNNGTPAWTDVIDGGTY